MGHCREPDQDEFKILFVPFTGAWDPSLLDSVNEKLIKALEAKRPIQLTQKMSIVTVKSNGIMSDDDALEELRKQDADIIIRGRIVNEGGLVTFILSLQSSPFFQSDFGEFGSNSDKFFEFKFTNAEMTDREQVLQLIEQRISILVEFTLSQFYLVSEQIVSARQAINASIELYQSQSLLEGEVLYLTRAVIARRQGDFKQAEEDAVHALKINPQYARAFLVQGNNAIAQALQSKKRNEPVDAQNKLSSAVSFYQRALSVQNPRSSEAYITEKAWLGLGNTLYWLSQYGDFEDAEKRLKLKEAFNYYQRVINEESSSNNLNLELKEVIAHAYYGRGAVKYYLQDIPGSLNDYMIACDRTSSRVLKINAQETIRKFWGRPWRLIGE
jgi:tetratricopeptide (TPR) repeat protein